MHLRIQIPARNEAPTLAVVVRTAREAASRLLREDDRLSVLILDDGSTDGTSEIGEALANEEACVRFWRSPEHIGLGRIFRAGIADARQSGADLVVHIDGDGQFDANEMGLLVDPIRRGAADLALGSRFLDPNLVPRMERTRRWGNAGVARWVSGLIGQPLADVSCGFRAFSSAALAAMELKANFTYTHESILLCAFAGLNILEVPVTVRGIREHGVSRLAANPLVYGWYAGRVIVRTTLSHRLFGAPASAPVVAEIQP